MNEVTLIRPTTDEQAARAVSAETLADLAERITSLPVGSVRARRSVRIRRPAIALALAGGLAAALLLAGSIGGTGGSLGPSNAQALSFATRGRYVVVTVRNPLADPARYQAEFAAHNLDVQLTLVPASPSLVGTVVYIGGSVPAVNSLVPVTAVGRCPTGGGGPVCPVGVKIPLDFHGSAQITFGRAARPGEQYESTTSATAPGEVMHGLPFKGRTVATVLGWLAARHVTVPQFRYTKGNYGYSPAPSHVHPNWYVHDAVPWASGQVLLFVGPTPSGR